MDGTSFIGQFVHAAGRDKGCGCGVTSFSPAASITYMYIWYNIQENISTTTQKGELTLIRIKSQESGKLYLQYGFETDLYPLDWDT